MSAKIGISNQMLIDANGEPLNKEVSKAKALVERSAIEINRLKRQIIQAKYDAAQTFVGNENHWAQADHLGPHSSASIHVRQRLRSRSRYEVIENNPYLKGTILTIANDFVGCGPKLQITDKRISEDRRQFIEAKFKTWFRIRGLRRKLWRMRMAKIVDGESFMRAYRNTATRHPVQLDFQVLEADRITSTFTTSQQSKNEIDGVRFDEYENPISYCVLRYHPGDTFINPMPVQFSSDWISAKYMIHWFRQDRGWLRGIPELTPSLPLCALLRRYTLAIVRHAETAADLTALIESNGNPSVNPWTDGQGNMITDTPFDIFPIEQGSIMNLPWGYTVRQLNAVPLGVQYDEFVGAILREITRPLLVTFNIVSGSSKDSNMASGVLDTSIYKGGQEFERLDCDETVLDPIFQLWFEEASRIPGYLGDNLLASDPQFRDNPLEHRWGWDRIGLDHTDPTKIAQSLQILRGEKILTDKDIQEGFYNRDIKDWQEQVTAEEEFRLSLETEKAKLEKAKGGPGNPDAQKPDSPSSNRNRSKASPRKA